ncbi:asparagine synthase (glutamine-hydrolyzing) [Catellatospora tritici]|uniref:asparagine synthase (glutamine-hydrolyzing) n=1 Tax=Catellatospora tritici TaxID=2851566 RepID=UPI001C2D6621|nr:asparagine synthase (glutamine-hydrolyzing) [Catellatospora tritici]MBV1849994.1 asparagine synthase (glutamine-hydrolyzing) [Catellatospora tritici]
MCGLVAWARIGAAAQAGVAPGVIEAMLRMVSHRGPDQEEILIDRHVALGFSRLSLVAPGAVSQPFTSADGRYSLVANGEVYNHRQLEQVTPGGSACRTGSDCEILLYLQAAHGPDFLRHIHGMISTIIWDRAANKLILSRDPFGVKPLFYHVSGDRVAVGSEIKALFADEATPRSVDWETSLAAASMHGTPLLSRDRAHTWFSDVRMVEAGTTVEINLSDGRVTIHRYWQPDLIPADHDSTAESFIERYRDTLTRSVRENREADAEVGLLLSGGIDSVTVAALTSPGMATFTVLAGSTAANGDAEFAFEAARLMGHLNHQILVPDEHTPSLEDWLRFLCLMETPLAGMEAYLKYLAYVGAKTVNPDLRGMMLGTGADEFNGGYSSELSRGEGWDGFSDALESLVRSTARTSGLGLSHWTDRDDLLDLVDPALAKPGSMRDAYAAFVDRKYLDVEQYNTWVEDRAAAGSSVEARVPFLDRDLVELSLSVPEHLRQELLWDKAMLRSGMRGVVPERLRVRDKQPFFHGTHANHTFDIVVRMLKANDFEMVRTAASGNAAVPFSVDSAIRFIEQVERRPSRSAIEFLLRLVNLSLLDQLAGGHALGLFKPGQGLPHGVEVTVYDRLSSSQSQSLLSNLDRQPDAVRYSLDDDCTAVTPLGDPSTILVARNGEFEVVIEEDVAAWTLLLTELGEPRSISALSTHTGLPDEQLEELLRDGTAAGFIRRSLEPGPVR